MQELDHFLMDDVSSLFQRQEVIVVGYSGTDNHIMKDLFAKIPPSNAVYWCTYKDNPVPEQVDEIVSNGHLCPVTKMPKALSLMRGFSCLRYPTLGTTYCHGDSIFKTRVTFSQLRGLPMSQCAPNLLGGQRRVNMPHTGPSQSVHHGVRDGYWSGHSR